jgi:hypothetical protein
MEIKSEADERPGLDAVHPAGSLDHRCAVFRLSRPAGVAGARYPMIAIRIQIQAFGKQHVYSMSKILECVNYLSNIS